RSPSTVEERQQERCRLAGAGLGLTNNIAAGKRFRDESGLNRGRLGVFSSLQGRQNRRGKSQRVEAVLRLHHQGSRQIDLLNEMAQNHTVFFTLSYSS